MPGQKRTSSSKIGHKKKANFRMLSSFVITRERPRLEALPWVGMIWYVMSGRKVWSYWRQANCKMMLQGLWRTCHCEVPAETIWQPGNPPPSSFLATAALRHLRACTSVGAGGSPTLWPCPRPVSRPNQRHLPGQTLKVHKTRLLTTQLSAT